MGDIRSMFGPKSVALIGATDRPDSIGGAILRNLLLNAARRVFPVNPHKSTLFDIPAYPDVSSLPERIDLGDHRHPGINRLLPSSRSAERQEWKVSIIVSSGFRETGAEGERLRGRGRGNREEICHQDHGAKLSGLHKAAYRPQHDAPRLHPIVRQHRLHLPERRLRPGAPGMGRDTHLGFSMFASLGSMIDVDLGDLIDFLGDDPHTRSIMIYMEEGIGDVKKFISAARGFARNKPIVLLKPARRSDGIANSPGPIQDIWRRATGSMTPCSSGSAWFG